LEPLGAVLLDWIEDSRLEPLEDHTVGVFDMIVAPRVGHQSIVDVDVVVLAVIPELSSSEQCSQVGDDPIRDAESVGDLLDQLM
jgi:hypothetical protein